MTIKSYRLQWDPDDPATPALIEPMLDDMGVEEQGELREAMIQHLKGLLENEWDMGNLSVHAHGFWDGYEACQKRILQPA